MKAIQRLTCGLLAVLLACFWLQGLADTQQVSCPTCGGRGSIGGATCALCGGSGSILMSGSRDGRDSANGITGTLPDTSYQNMLIDGDYLSVHLFADGTRSMMYQKLRALNVSTVVHLRSPYSPQTYDTLSAVGTIQSLSELLSRHVNGFQLSLTDRFSEEDYDNARAMFASSADGPLSCLYLMFAQGKRSAFILTQDGVAETREAALAEALCAWLDAGLVSALPAGLEEACLICARLPRDPEADSAMVPGAMRLDGDRLAAAELDGLCSLFLTGGESVEPSSYTLGVEGTQTAFAVTRWAAADADYLLLTRQTAQAEDAR